MAAAKCSLVKLPLLTGQVTDSVTMKPLVGVKVNVMMGTTLVAWAKTDFSGHYKVYVATGTYDVTFSRYPYQTLTDTAAAVTGPTTTLDAGLVKLPLLTGQVTDSITMMPLAGVKVKVMMGTTVVAWAKTDFSGHYKVYVAAGTYDVTFSRYFYETLTDAAVVVTGPATTLDAALIHM